MKDLYITIHNGGDEAVAAVQRMGEDWRAQLEQAAAEVERLRLSDEEREAIERLEDYCAKTHCVDTARTLRGLLDRIGHQ